MLLDPSENKMLFLSILKRAGKKYAFQIENFCIMGNHIHLIIKPGAGENLSSIMQWILSVFAMAYNRKHALTGHVWGERFFSRILENFKQLIDAFAYIDTNPVRAHQTDNPRSWPFGGLWHQRHGCRDILPAAPEWLLLLFPERESRLLTFQN